VAADLAAGRRCRIGAERRTEPRVEALDRLEDPDHRHLGQILELLTVALELPGDDAGQPPVVFDDLVAHRPVAGRPVVGDRFLGASGHQPVSLGAAMIHWRVLLVSQRRVSPRC
jgi:hypothetical protein